mgnify:CR=1 FL=1
MSVLRAGERLAIVRQWLKMSRGDFQAETGISATRLFDLERLRQKVHDTDIHFTFVLEGTMTLKAKGEPDRTLSAGDALVLPPGLAAQYSDCSADLELLEATLPAGFTTTVTSL